LIRLAAEKSLQFDLIALKGSDDYAKSWQPLLIMYRSRHEKRLAWKEKAQDFEKIEQALVEQQKELNEIEDKLPKPLKTKKKKDKPAKPRSKQTVVCVLDLENRTAEPFGNYPIDDDVNDNVVKVQADEQDEQNKSSSIPMQTELLSISNPTAAPVINDPFFLNSQHQITHQKRTAQDKEDVDLDDRAFIEHSYFIDALSSSSNRRDGGGDHAKKKWAHLSAPARSHPGKTRSTATGKSKGMSIQYIHDMEFHLSYRVDSCSFSTNNEIGRYCCSASIVGSE
jgi:hypothetical protein